MTDIEAHEMDSIDEKLTVAALVVAGGRGCIYTMNEQHQEISLSPVLLHRTRRRQQSMQTNVIEVPLKIF
jgi:hypothetical protein